MMVRCIDDTSSDLTVGRDYEVEQETKNYFTVKGNEGIWRKERFIIIDENSPTTQRSPKSGKEEVDEWKIWRDINKAPGYCPCGILRHKCDYHK